MCESYEEIYCYGRRRNHSVSLSNLHRKTASHWIMKILQLSTRTLFGGLLGISLAFLLAEFCSQGLYEIYSTSTFFRTVTGNSPNSLAESLNQVSWALLFCGGWWMLWSFDHFFIPVEEKAKSKFSESEDSPSSTDAKEDETFKPRVRMSNKVHKKRVPSKRVKRHKKKIQKMKSLKSKKVSTTRTTIFSRF